MHSACFYLCKISHSASLQQTRTSGETKTWGAQNKHLRKHSYIDDGSVIGECNNREQAWEPSLVSDKVT